MGRLRGRCLGLNGLLNTIPYSLEYTASGSWSCHHDWSSNLWRGRWWRRRRWPGCSSSHNGRSGGRLPSRLWLVGGNAAIRGCCTRAFSFLFFSHPFRKFYLQILIIKVRMLSSKHLHSLLCCSLNLVVMSFFGVIKEWAISDLPPSCWVVKMVVVLDCLGADIAICNISPAYIKRSQFTYH